MIQRRNPTPGGGTKPDRRKTYRALMCFDAAGGTHVLDVTCGVALGRPRHGTDVFQTEGIKTREEMFTFLFGEDGKRAGMSFAFHPEASRDNVTPKPEDFISQDFRLLTATIVGGGSWKATDFTNAAMLKASLGMLNRKPVYTDHNTNISNWAGIVTKPVWQDKSTAAGIAVPPGINATLLIDSKVRPEVARGVMLGSINSNSVTIEFEWEASHAFEREWEFMDRIGEMHKDGKMIRRVVTKIKGYHETSLVWLGADPYAKALDANGNLVTVDTAHTFSKAEVAEQTSYKDKNRYALSFGYDPDVVRLALHLQKDTPTPSTKKAMNPELLAALLAFFKVEKEDQLTKDHAAQFEALTKNAPKVARFDKVISMGAAKDANLGTADDAAVEKFVGEHTIVTNVRHGELVNAELELNKMKTAGDPVALKTKVEELTSANTTLKADAELGKEFTKGKREALVAMYKKSLKEGTAPDDTMLEQFNKAEGKALDAFLKQFGGDAANKFGAKCTECGSGKVEFRSSVETPSDDPAGKTTTARTPQQIAEDHRKGKSFNIRKGDN